MSLASHYATSRCAISFELFPPKTEAGLASLCEHVRRVTQFQPSFFTCTYGAGGSTQGIPLLASAIPELGGETYADGVKGEADLALLGVSRDGLSTNLMTQWSHHVDEPYRVREIFSAFPPGGATNDPTIDQGF